MQTLIQIICILIGMAVFAVAIIVSVLSGSALGFTVTMLVAVAALAWLQIIQ